MVEKTDQAHQLSSNPIISKLKEKGGRAPALFAGWVGAGSAEGIIRLYPNIHDLTYYVEFESADVVHSTDVHENVLPFGAKAIWVKPEARVRLTRSVRTSASQVSGFLRRASGGSRSSRAWMLGPSITSSNLGTARQTRDARNARGS